MRKILIAILMAGAAASPALAQDHGRWHRDQQQSDDKPTREERREAREERQQVREQARAERSNGGANFERAQPNPAPVEVRQQVQGDERGWDRARFERRDAPPQQVVNQPGEATSRSAERRGRWNRDDGPTRSEGPAVIQREGFAQDGAGLAGILGVKGATFANRIGRCPTSCAPATR